MSAPSIPTKSPFAVDVQAGKDYWWCSCGRSARQPFCDGSHKGTEFQPVKYTAAADGKVWLCGCKHTGKAPMCDGTHSRL